MTMNNPLETLRAFSPTAQGITQAAQAGTNIQTSGLQQDLLNRQIQGQDFANQSAVTARDAAQQKLASQANIQNTAANLTRLNTALGQGATAEQIAILLQQNIQRAQAQGGDGADSMEALQVLQQGGLGALKNLAGQATAVFQEQGVLDRPKLEQVETAGGIGSFNPNTGKIIVGDGAEITTAQWKAANEERIKKIADDAKLIKDKETQSDNLRGEVTKLSKELQFTDTFSAFNRIQATNDGTAGGDLALIFNFMKMLDPGSVVRESEFATAAGAASVPERLKGAYNRVITGERLTKAQRDNFTDQASKIYGKAKTGFESTVAPILNIGKSRGLTKTDILGEGFFESFTVTDDGQGTQVTEEVVVAPVIVAHPTFGDVSEEDIQQTMIDNNMTRDQVLQALGG